MTQKSNSIINSLKRLERVGSENSRVTEKLKNACNEVGKKIVETIQDYCEDVTSNIINDFRIVNLPRGYRMIKIETQDTKRWTLIAHDHEQDHFKYHPYNRSLAYNPHDITREDALQFAKDISEGLLDEITAFVQKECEQMKAATKGIEQAINVEIV